jgi:hypothetical protein
LEIRKHIEKLYDVLPKENFQEQAFKEVKTKLKEKIESANPLVEGRKVGVDNYLTSESGYTEFSFSGRRGLIYKKEVQFFDSLKFKDIHLLYDIENGKQYYAQGDSIKLDFYDYRYKDFCELLDIYYLLRNWVYIS